MTSNYERAHRAPRHEAGLVATLVAASLGLLVAYRTEIALLVVLYVTGHVATATLGPDYGTEAVLGALGLVAVIPWSRSNLLHLLYRGHVRRHWNAAVAAAAISSFRGRGTKVGRVAKVPVGQRLGVAVPSGASVADLESHAEVLAAALGARQLRVQRWSENARWARVTIVRRDPFDNAAPGIWPWEQAQHSDFWRPFPVGVSEDGEVVGMNLVEHNLLVAGEPGSGKSAAMSLVLAAAALDPFVSLYLLDAKLVELAPWRGCAKASVGPDIDEAIELLRSLQVEMEARYVELLAARRRKVSPELRLGLHVVVCDELAMYLQAPDKAKRQVFAEIMRDLVARGRAAGVIVVAATQKPSSDIVPTSLRDLFGFRWAMRCVTRDASDTILGSGWASQGVAASDVDAATRGVGYLLAEGAAPVRLRSYYLDDAAIESIAARAEALRRVIGLGKAFGPQR